MHRLRLRCSVQSAAVQGACTVRLLGCWVLGESYVPYTLYLPRRASAIRRPSVRCALCAPVCPTNKDKISAPGTANRQPQRPGPGTWHLAPGTWHLHLAEHPSLCSLTVV
eukprot:scaffold5696_cov119-Isochrysis_galbana.AAC.6